MIMRRYQFSDGYAVDDFLEEVEELRLQSGVINVDRMRCQITFETNRAGDYSKLDNIYANGRYNYI